MSAIVQIVWYLLTNQAAIASPQNVDPVPLLLQHKPP